MATLNHQPRIWALTSKPQACASCMLSFTISKYSSIWITLNDLSDSTISAIIETLMRVYHWHVVSEYSCHGFNAPGPSCHKSQTRPSHAPGKHWRWSLIIILRSSPPLSRLIRGHIDLRLYVSTTEVYLIVSSTIIILWSTWVSYRFLDVNSKCASHRFNMKVSSERCTLAAWVLGFVAHGNAPHGCDRYRSRFTVMRFERGRD